MKISVVLNTLNEEKNLPYALESVKSWATEIIVVDMYSDDATIKIAKSYGAEVFLYERLGFSEPARAFAVSKATGDWILILDADELIPKELYLRLIKFVEKNEGDIANIPRKNFLLGREFKFSGWSPQEDRQTRFFRSGTMRLTGEIHNFMHPLEGSRVVNLDFKNNEAIVHFNYINSRQFIEKLNRYTDIEAKQSIENNVSLYRIFAKIPLELVRRLLIQKAYKDGWQGIAVSFYMMFYRLVSYFKFIELRTIGDQDKVLESYSNIAQNTNELYELQKTVKDGVYIIIVNWNGWRMTVDCIESLDDVGKFKEIVIVDNGSTDGSFEILKSIYPNLTIISSEHNLGFGGGNTIGIQYALRKNAEYVWLLNNDTIVFDQTLESLISCINEVEVGAVSSALYRDLQCKNIQTIGAGHVDSYGLTKEITTYREIGRNDYLCAASILIKTEVLEEIGLFDESFFLYWEDVDLSFRIIAAGWKLRTCPSSKVFHRESASLGKKNIKTKKYFKNSAEIFYKKHYAYSLPYSINAKLRFYSGNLFRKISYLVTNRYD